MMQQTYLRRLLTPHSCKLSITYSATDTPKECNSLIYTYEKKTYNFYKINSITDDSVLCYRLGRYSATFNDLPSLQWKNVGVFEWGGLGNNIVRIQNDQIAGKALKVSKYLITCPKNILREK